MRILRIFVSLTIVISFAFAVSALAGDKTYEAIQINPIKVDGDLSDWPTGLVMEELTVLGAFNMPTGPDDLTAKFMAGYNVAENRLYIATIVTDDSPFAILPITDGGSWANDRNEIYIDGDNSKTDTHYLFETAQQYNIYGPAEQKVKINGGERVVLNYPGGGQQEYKDDDFLAAAKRTGTQTVYEASIVVYKTFKKEVAKLVPGAVIGFDMAIVDNDDGTDANSTFFFWSEGGGKFQNETVFGTMIFSSAAAAVKPLGKITTTWGDIKR